MPEPDNSTPAYTEAPIAVGATTNTKVSIVRSGAKQMLTLNATGYGTDRAGEPSAQADA